MDFISLVRTRVLGQWHGVPLPTLATDTSISFQPWCQFNPYTCEWTTINPADEAASLSSTNETGPEESPRSPDPELVLVTWNIDATSPASATRISDAISHLRSLNSPVDVIFLQEVSRSALAGLLDIPWLRESWYMSDIDASKWGKQAFGSVTLLSKSRFTFSFNNVKNKMKIGPVWRVRYPSRFERDALCCDVIPPAPVSSGLDGRIRLVNVHLDSLPIQPSLRPGQVSTVASFLHAAGCGVVAGDFNPVLPGDDGLVGANGLGDVWNELCPGEPGFTWGVDGQEPFPPNRMDRVAVVGLTGEWMRVIPPGLSILNSKKHGDIEPVRWSDHSGLICSLKR